MGPIFKCAKEMKYNGGSRSDHIDVLVVYMREREMGLEGKDVRNSEKRGKSIA